MSDQIEEKEGKETHKEALKKLKAARKEQIAAATSLMKEQRRVLKAIKEQLADNEMTVPEVWRNPGRPQRWQLLSLPAGTTGGG
jgi:hypothetical protein